MSAWLDAAPTATGPAGVAWDLLDEQMAAARAKGTLRPEQEAASLGFWIVHLDPPQHLFWSWYVAMLVHLRPVEGTPPAHLDFPAATHELLVLALDPKDSPPKPGTLPFLQPPNVKVQAACASDDLATATFVKVVSTGILEGVLPVESSPSVIALTGLDPDRGARSAAWRTVFEQTYEHLVTGGHHL